MQVATAGLLGLLFGLGILISGMGNPAKVLNFFDIAGSWDPSLAFVMGGGLLVNMLGYRLVLRRPRPIFNADFRLPGMVSIDTALVGGAIVFGIGWGLSGFCPGGLLPVLALERSEPWLFLLGLLLGIAAARHVRTRALIKPQS